MTNIVSINFGLETLFKTSSAEMLEAKLREMYQSFDPENPFIAIGHTNKSYLACGISKDCNFIIYHPPTDVKPYYTSLGDTNLEIHKEPIYIFRMHDRWTEMYGRACIPFEDFVSAIKEYLMTGQKPSNIQWDEDK